MLLTINNIIWQNMARCYMEILGLHKTEWMIKNESALSQQKSLKSPWGNSVLGLGFWDLSLFTSLKFCPPGHLTCSMWSPGERWGQRTLRRSLWEIRYCVSNLHKTLNQPHINRHLTRSINLSRQSQTLSVNTTLYLCTRRRRCRQFLTSSLARTALRQ